MHGIPSPRSRGRRRTAILVMLLLGLALLAGKAPPVALAATVNTAITVDGTSAGSTFGGIGAISGGGGNTRLLTDYPAAEQEQILDYLFTPGVGADLQILKVEIGGDTNSTDGSESSIEHTAGSIDCNNGYEWWLMEQAKDRNPNIKLYGLSWGAPGWIGGGNFWSTDMINYLVPWLGCAKTHGLSINYLGGWNERGYTISWYEQLRSTLNADGYSSVTIVADDSFNWDDASAIDGNPAFAAAVGILGDHYPCGFLTAMTSCSATAAATSSGKPLWASENGAEDNESGTAVAVARAVNLRQMATTTPIRWTDEASDQPYTLIGDLNWSNYTVSSDVLLEKSGSAAEILGRVGTNALNNNGLDAYHLRLSDTGAWELTSWNWTTLASGNVTAPGTGTSDSGGQVGLGTAGYYPVEYSDFSVTPGTVPALSGTYTIKNAYSGNLLDAYQNGTANGTLIDQ
jgi:Glycosyl hydrolase family 59